MKTYFDRKDFIPGKINQSAVSNIEEMIESAVRVRLSMYQSEHMATGRGVKQDAIAVVGKAMGDALVTLFVHWDSKADPSGASMQEMMEQFTGRKTIVIGSAPAYSIKYYDDLEAVKKSYPYWWETQSLFTKEDDNE